MANILLVHECAEARRFLCARLSQGGHQVECVRSGKALSDVVGTHRTSYDLVVVSLSIPAGCDDSVALARAFGADCPVLVINGSHDNIPEGSSVLEKPFTDRELLGAVDEAIRGGR